MNKGDARVSAMRWVARVLFRAEEGLEEDQLVQEGTEHTWFKKHYPESAHGTSGADGRERAQWPKPPKG